MNRSIRLGIVALALGWLAAGCGRLGFDPVDRTSNARDAVTDSSLVAYYLFDDDPSTGVLDATGRGHTGTCNPCPALVRGRVGGAYDFAGMNAPVTVPFHPDFATSGGLTVSAWVYRVANAVTGRRTVATKNFGAFGNNSWQLSEFDIALENCSSDGGTQQCNNGGMIARDTWVHVGVTWDGSQYTGWVNGSIVFSYASGMDLDASDLELGGELEQGTASNPFAGRIDELRIYNRALDAFEIAALTAP